MKLGTREQQIIDYINASDALWCRPTEIGQNVWGGRHHSSTASPVCRRMVNKGLLIRSRDGRYRLRGENEKAQTLRQGDQTRWKTVQKINAESADQPITTRGTMRALCLSGSATDGKIGMAAPSEMMVAGVTARTRNAARL